ncbi:MAG: S8 family serine peptidase [bacterium]|nr:S8 family serine peptidase [bacterium]
MGKFIRLRMIRAIVLSCLIPISAFSCQKSRDPVAPVSVRSEDLSPGTENNLIEKDYMPGEVLVVLTDEAEASKGKNFFSGLHLSPLREKAYHWGTLHRMSITDGTSVEDMCEILKSDPRVKIAEPNFLVHFCEAPYTPNDPMWENPNDADNDPRTTIWEQWGPAKLGASLVWNDTKGDEEVIVAVLDTGIRRWHEDLWDSVWINEVEYQNPDDGIDNDNNGWIDDWWGWNCWEQNNVPYDIDGSNVYHGSACAGVIAAMQDNGIGCSGLAPHVRVMAIRANCGILTTGPVDNVVEGWDYAKTNGADIISMSFYVDNPTEVLELAAYDTWDNGNGPVMFAAAGNFNGTTVKYPAGYDCVIAVSAVCPFTNAGVPHDEERISPSWGGWGWGSSYGDHIDVSGYGERYYTTWGGNDTEYWDGVHHWFFNGTSCATPTCAGVMALIMSYNPGHDGNWYRARIIQTADDIMDPGFDIYTGNGRINAFRGAYGSDRFSGLEDENGFVPLDLTQDGIELYDSIDDVSTDNPYADKWDLYKITADSTGCAEIYLDIFTWGEDIDMAIFADPSMSEMISESTGENHADSSFEITDISVTEGSTYYLSVYSPDLGNSTTYGLKINYIVNSLDIVHESVAPVTAAAGDTDVPFLKLTFGTKCSSTLDEIILNKHSTGQLGLLGALKLYVDSNGSGIFDAGDTLIGSDINPTFNRTRFSDLALEFSVDNPLVLFAVADIDPAIDPGSQCYISMETYKDVTVEAADVGYSQFPISSGVVGIE